MSLFKKIDLKNGLTLEMHDISRKLAGDRWYVGFIARMDIPLKGLFSNNSNSGEIDSKKMEHILGEEIRFEQKRDRHFIGEKEKDALLNRLVDDFLKSTLSYLSHSDFGKKYALKEYKERLAMASWYRKGNSIGSV
ncbi:hypothetical protein ACFL0O_06705 [Thermodesulfobacteriota bacterium]